MQLGFVIDQSRCIGCHACTVTCKSENDVPVASFRTWVKYTETGEFPSVRRSFTVLRCNQCTDAPCVTICPVRALHRRPDGIVDVDPGVCIGCKACMQACPYDALYIHDGTGTAQKCHFCAHRIETGLAPACAVVCPTEAIIPGDLHDPGSRVSRMRANGDLSVRKLEAGTRPNVFYERADESGLDPLLTTAAAGSLWANPIPGPQLDAQTFEAFEERAKARTVYDVAHPPLWGAKVTAYLFTKSLAAGAFLAGVLVMPPLLPGAGLAGAGTAWVPALALVFLLATTALLVADLERPDRLLLVLKRPNPHSWLARGTAVLVKYAVLLALWLGLALVPNDVLETGLGMGAGGVFLALVFLGTSITAAVCACYTAWLFGQSKGRVLWMRRGLWLHLVAQAFLAGSALLLLLSPGIGLGLEAIGRLRVALLASLALHLGLTLVEGRLAPAGRAAEYERTVRLVSRGPFARKHWVLGVGLGIVVPIVLLLLFMPQMLWSAAAALALLGLYVEEDVLVRAGQALPIS